MAYPLAEKAKKPAFTYQAISFAIIALRLIALCASLIVMLPLHLLWRLFRLPSPWPRFFLWSVARNCGATVKVEGHVTKQPVFYVANHISWFDIPVIAGATGCTFIANDGIESWPLIGWLCKLNHTIFVSRSNKLGVSDQIAQIRDAIDGGYAITIFPEGTTSDAISLLPFKPSLFQVLAPPPRPILLQPVYVDYGLDGADIAWVGEEPVVANAGRLLSRRRPLRITVHLLEPLDPAEHGDRKAICAETERRISAAHSAFRREVR